MQKAKRLLPVFLAVLMLFSCLYPAASAAVGDQIAYTRRLAYRGGQQSGEGNINAPGNRGNHYNNRPYWYDGFSIDVLTITGSGVDLLSEGISI